MPKPQDYEELCAQLKIIVERSDLNSDEKVSQLRQLLMGADQQSGEQEHQWRETGSERLPEGDGEMGAAEGQSVQYVCTRCGARGYQIVFSTSVTMYPIVTDDPVCPR